MYVVGTANMTVNYNYYYYKTDCSYYNSITMYDHFSTIYTFHGRTVRTVINIVAVITIIMKLSQQIIIKSKTFLSVYITQPFVLHNCR